MRSSQYRKVCVLVRLKWKCCVNCQQHICVASLGIMHLNTRLLACHMVLYSLCVANLLHAPHSASHTHARTASDTNPCLSYHHPSHAGCSMSTAMDAARVLCVPCARIAKSVAFWGTPLPTTQAPGSTVPTTTTTGSPPPASTSTQASAPTPRPWLAVVRGDQRLELSKAGGCALQAVLRHARMLAPRLLHTRRARGCAAVGCLMWVGAVRVWAQGTGSCLTRPLPLAAFVLATWLPGLQTWLQLAVRAHFMPLRCRDCIG